MVTKVIMPKFGLSMETGVLGSWLVEEGDSVTKGSALAEITTDKITNTCEAPKDGDSPQNPASRRGGGCLRGGHSGSGGHGGRGYIGGVRGRPE